MSFNNIEIISGGSHTDERGVLSFFNDFDMRDIKRFYIIEHSDTKIIRAWQGHQYEQKWFYVIAGAFKLAIIKPDNWRLPSPDLKPEVLLLAASQPKIVHVPGGYATGFCALEDHSKMIIFSNTTVEESKKDDFRFNKNLWTSFGFA